MRCRRGLSLLLPPLRTLVTSIPAAAAPSSGEGLCADRDMAMVAIGGGMDPSSRTGRGARWFM